MPEVYETRNIDDALRYIQSGGVQLKVSGYIGDAGARALADALKENSVLTSLDLWSNNIGDTGAELLADALKVNHALTDLDLRDSNIGEAGAEALADALKVNHVLTDLDLMHNKIGATGAGALADALKVNSVLTNLNLEWNNIGAAGAGALADALKENSVLTSLDLWSNNIGDTGAELLADALKVNHVLTILGLGYNSIGAAGARALADALKVNHVLTTLGLRFNKIGDAGARALADALKANHALTNLDLCGNKIGEAGAGLLADALKVNHALTTLDLRENNIGEAGAIALAGALKVNHVLTTLGLKGNNIGAAEAIALAEALKVNSVLTNLDLGINKISDAGAKALADALVVNHVLTTLDLEGNNIGAEEMKAITDLLKARADSHQSSCVAHFAEATYANPLLSDPSFAELLKLSQGSSWGVDGLLSLGDDAARLHAFATLREKLGSEGALVAVMSGSDDAGKSHVDMSYPLLLVSVIESKETVRCLWHKLLKPMAPEMVDEWLSAMPEPSAAAWTALHLCGTTGSSMALYGTDKNTLLAAVSYSSLFGIKEVMREGGFSYGVAGAHILSAVMSKAIYPEAVSLFTVLGTSLLQSSMLFLPSPAPVESNIEQGAIYAVDLSVLALVALKGPHNVHPVQHALLALSAVAAADQLTRAATHLLQDWLPESLDVNSFDAGGGHEL